MGVPHGSETPSYWKPAENDAGLAGLRRLQGAFLPVTDCASQSERSLLFQNAARLAYPSTKLGKLDGIEEARARFLLDEFPPRGGTATGPSPDPHGPPTPPTPAPA